MNNHKDYTTTLTVSGQVDTKIAYEEAAVLLGAEFNYFAMRSAQKYAHIFALETDADDRSLVVLKGVHRFALDDALTDRIAIRLAKNENELRHMAQAYVQLVHLCDTEECDGWGVSLEDDKAEILIGGEWSEPLVLTINMDIEGLADIIGRRGALERLTCDDIKASYDMLCLTPNDWRMLVGTHAAARLDIPVRASIGGYSFNFNL